MELKMDAVPSEPASLHERLESAQRTIVVRNAALRAEQVHRERSVADLKSFKDEWQREDARARERLDASGRREAELTQRLASRQEAVVKLQEELEQAAEESRLSEAEREVLRHSLAQEANRADRLETEIERAIERSRQAEDERKRLQQSLADASSRVEELVEMAAAAEQAVAAARKTRSKVEKRLSRLEGVYGDVLAAIPQMHRRALATQSELLQLKLGLDARRASMRGRLSTVFRSRARSPARWAGMPAALWRELNTHTDALNPGSLLPTDDEPLETIRFTEGKPELSLPITLRAQRVALPPLATRHELLAVALLPDIDAEVLVELASGSGSAENFVHVAGRKLDTRETAGGARNSVRLKANETRRLLVRQGGAGEACIELRRVSGPFCILKLQLVGTTANSRRAVPSTMNSLAAAMRSGPPPAVTGIASRAMELEEKLWGGYSRYAIEELKLLAVDEKAVVAERERANWSLCRWYFVEEDFEAALRYVRDARTLIDHRPSTSLGEAQCLVNLGRYYEAGRVLDAALEALPRSAHDVLLYKSTVDSEIARQAGKSSDEIESCRLGMINEVLRQANMATLEKRIDERPLGLDNIRSTNSSEVVAGAQRELVSIVIPAYNAASSIEWVIESLLAQTWRNLEVIVVDDLSTDETSEIVERLASSDSRVRLIRKVTNDGAYPTRNIGAQAARGEYLTVHDSDDWSHPQKIEMQLAALRSRPNRIASVSHWVRVDEKMRILGAWRPRASFFDLNFSSLLFRREVLAQVGYWDNVLISGDAEFYRRLLLRYGHDAITKVPSTCLLALSLTRENSLTRSRATHLRSLDYGIRWNYRDAFTNWHASVLPTDAVLEPSAGPRPFPVPLGNRRLSGQPLRYELVVICDFARKETVESASALGYLEASAKAGRLTAAIHWRRYTERSTSALPTEFYRLCTDHDIHILSPGDQVDAEAVLVTDPAVLQYRIDPAPTISARRVAVLVAGLSNVSAIRRQDMAYDTATVRDHATDIFDQVPEWIGAANVIARFLEGWIDPLSLLATNWLPPVAQQFADMPEAVLKTSVEHDRPVLGISSALSRGEWSADAITWLADLAKGEGRTMPHFNRITADIASILGMEFPGVKGSVGSSDFSEFASHIDFLIHLPRPEQALDFDIDVLRAMCLGIPVCTICQSEPLYKEGAAYANVADVESMVLTIWKSKALYAEHARGAKEFVRTGNHQESIAARLSTLIAGKEVRDARTQVDP